MRKPKIRCPSCGSSQAYIRLRTHQIVCPECGDVTPKRLAPPEEKKDFTREAKI